MNEASVRDALEQLYEDALELYERARAEVTIPKSDGTRQKYAPVRYKQQIERAYQNNELVPAIARTTKQTTVGFGHLEAAGRPDLMLETLVLDKTKPYRLFDPKTVRIPQQRMLEYAARPRRDDVTARIGADDIGLWESPRRELLREISAIEPEPSLGIHVLLDEHLGVRSTQRLALTDVGGAIVVALWPAELKRQADYLYMDGRGVAMVGAARERGWDVRPSPHLAFFTAAPSQRLYMTTEVDAEEYAERWEGSDGRRIGQYSSDEVVQLLWPWLKERGYASAEDDDVLVQFLAILGRRKAHLRPGMRLQHRWPAEATSNQHELAGSVRRDVNTILAAAGEPILSAST